MTPATSCSVDSRGTFRTKTVVLIPFASRLPYSRERCLPRQKSRVKRLKARVIKKKKRWVVGLTPATSCSVDSRGTFRTKTVVLMSPPIPTSSGLGVKVQFSGFRVQSSGFRVQGSGFRVQGTGYRVQGPGFREALAQGHEVVRRETLCQPRLYRSEG